jgi:hypothetical protein
MCESDMQNIKKTRGRFFFFLQNCMCKNHTKYHIAITNNYETRKLRLIYDYVSTLRTLKHDTQVDPY